MRCADWSLPRQRGYGEGENRGANVLLACFANLEASVFLARDAATPCSLKTDHTHTNKSESLCRVSMDAPLYLSRVCSDKVRPSLEACIVTIAQRQHT